MSLYYQDDLVTLYHGDCREIRHWLSADLLVMDPPYGIGWTRGVHAARGSKSHNGIENDESTDARDAVLDMWRWDATRPRPAIVFGSLYAPHPTDVRHILIWEKPGDAGVVGSTTGYRRDVEAVFLCGMWPKRSASWGSVVRSALANSGNPYSPAGRTGHPHAKPVDLMCRLIERAPIGKIADPFAGSGSTLIAAKHLGLPAVGVELSERHCETAAERLTQSVLDFTEGAA